MDLAAAVRGWRTSLSATVLGLVTYVGAGTELLPDDAADRGAMGRGHNGHVLDAARIATVPTGAVLLMRGDLSTHGPGVLHRSPPNPLRSPCVLFAIDA